MKLTRDCTKVAVTIPKDYDWDQDPNRMKRFVDPENPNLTYSRNFPQGYDWDKDPNRMKRFVDPENPNLKYSREHPEGYLPEEQEF